MVLATLWVDIAIFYFLITSLQGTSREIPGGFFFYSRELPAQTEMPREFLPTRPSSESRGSREFPGNCRFWANFAICTSQGR